MDNNGRGQPGLPRAGWLLRGYFGVDNDGRGQLGSGGALRPGVGTVLRGWARDVAEAYGRGA